MVSTALALALTVGTLVVFAALGTWYSRGRIESIEDFTTARGDEHRRHAVQWYRQRRHRTRW